MNWFLFASLVFFFVCFAAVAFYFWKKFTTKKFSSEQLQYMKAHWIRIIDSFDMYSNQGVMDADKLLDYALKCYGYEGTLGDKLKIAKSRFSDLNGVWSAHKLRNTLAHELVKVSKEDGRRALKQFKQALNDLGANL